MISRKELARPPLIDFGCEYSVTVTLAIQKKEIKKMKLVKGLIVSRFSCKIFKAFSLVNFLKVFKSDKKMHG